MEWNALSEKGTTRKEGTLHESQMLSLCFQVCILFLRMHKTSHMVSLIYTTFSKSQWERNVDTHSTDASIQFPQKDSDNGNTICSPLNHKAVHTIRPQKREAQVSS